VDTSAKPGAAFSAAFAIVVFVLKNMVLYPILLLGMQKKFFICSTNTITEKTQNTNP
jgi:hypothetical protein